MGRNVNNIRLNKNYILERVSQISIFSTYLNLSNTEIQNCINTGSLIISPLRSDTHPTCGFRYDNRGKLKFRDFAGFFWGDCFDVVAYILSEIKGRTFDVSKKEDFTEILKHITITFKNIFYGQDRDINLSSNIEDAINSIKTKKPKIELVVRNWNKQDLVYWAQFGLDANDLNKEFIYPIEQFYIDRNVNPEPKYYYDNNDPCYAYILGRDKQGQDNIKLYFPYRKKGNVRFITNCNHLEGIYTLYDNKYDIIVITKSTKDRISMKKVVEATTTLYGQVNKDKIGFISIPHETYKLRQIEYDWLVGKLVNRGFIVSFMDNDETGKREAIWLKKNYGINAVLIPSKYGVKDFAELYNKYKFNKVAKMIIATITKVKDNERKRNQCIWDYDQSDALPY